MGHKQKIQEDFQQSSLWGGVFPFHLLFYLPSGMEMLSVNARMRHTPQEMVSVKNLEETREHLSPRLQARFLIKRSVSHLMLSQLFGVLIGLSLITMSIQKIKSRNTTYLATLGNFKPN